MGTVEYINTSSFAPERGDRDDLRNNVEARRIAIRTAFVSRFIVLRENRRTKAHRIIENLVWTNEASAEELYEQFRNAFIENGDKLMPVDRDLRRALSHAYCSIEHFMAQYLGRSTTSFEEALKDYHKSNVLLFGEDDVPKIVGWRIG